MKFSYEIAAISPRSLPGPRRDECESKVRVASITREYARLDISKPTILSVRKTRYSAVSARCMCTASTRMILSVPGASLRKVVRNPIRAPKVPGFISGLLHGEPPAARQYRDLRQVGGAVWTMLSNRDGDNAHNRFHRCCGLRGTAASFCFGCKGTASLASSRI
jgi:hypothetical protein